MEIKFDCYVLLKTGENEWTVISAFIFDYEALEYVQKHTGIYLILLASELEKMKRKGELTFCY